jgi:fucose permease
MPDSYLMMSTPRLKIALAFCSFIMIGASDGTLGVILPSMRVHYHVDNATISLIFLAGTIGYFTATFNNGLLIERLGYRHFLMLATATYLLCAVIISLTPLFFIVPGAFLLFGAAVAMLDAGLNTYVASLPHNTSQLNYLHAFYGAGAWLGPVVASAILALAWDWNSVYLVWGGMSLLLLLGFSAIFKERLATHKGEMRSGRYNSVTTLRLRVVWLAAFFLLFYVGSEVSLGNWSYSLLTEERGRSLLVSGWIVSGYWLGLTMGRLIMGKLAQKIGNRRLIEGCLIGVIIGLLLVWAAPIQPISALGLCLTGFCLGPIFPTTIALLSTMLTSRLLAGAIGFVTSLGSMGAALFPWLAGNLAQRVGLWSLLPFVILLTVTMFCLWFALQRSPRAALPPES